jgi:hypothetical protein
MLVLTIATTVVGFALGAYATYRFTPTLARTSGSVAFAVVPCGLVGAASGLACLYIYLAIYEFVKEPALNSGLATATGQSLSASPDANIFVNAVYSIASESGVLLALAAAVFLLAAPHRAGTG